MMKAKMATGIKPQKKAPPVYYQCHPTQRCGAVICIICDRAYHSSDFESVRGGRKVSSTLVICPEHPDVNLTSNIKELSLTEQTRALVAQIKLFEKDKIQQELCDSLSETINEDSEDVADNFVDCSKSEVIACYKREIAIHKQLIVELQDKNTLLKELVNKSKESPATYASVASKPHSAKVQHVPLVVIKAKSEDKAKDTISEVMRKIQSKVVVPIVSVKSSKDGTVTVECKHSSQVTRATEILSEEIGAQFDVRVKALAKPRVKVVGIESSWPLATLVDDINMRNFPECEFVCVGVHSYVNTKSNQQSIILELTPELYLRVRENNYKIFVGHQCCRVYDDINVRPCFKCGRFGHSTTKCENPPVCLCCAGDHLSNVCSNTSQPRCVNCTFVNQKYGHTKNVYHTAVDCEKCDLLKTKIAKKISETDYPVKPMMPKSVGKVGPTTTTNTKSTGPQRRASATANQGATYSKQSNTQAAKTPDNQPPK